MICRTHALFEAVNCFGCIGDAHCCQFFGCCHAQVFRCCSHQGGKLFHLIRPNNVANEHCCAVSHIEAKFQQRNILYRSRNRVPGVQIQQIIRTGEYFRWSGSTLLYNGNPVVSCRQPCAATIGRQKQICSSLLARFRNEVESTVAHVKGYISIIVAIL